MILIVALDGGGIGVAAIDGDLFREIMATYRLVQEAPSRLFVALLGQQKVNGLTVLVHGEVEINLLTFDSNVGLVHPPRDPHGALAAVEFVFQLWAILDDPAVDGGVIHLDATFFHKFFNMAGAY